MPPAGSLPRMVHRVGLAIVLALVAVLHNAESAQTNITSLCSPHATPPLLKKGEATYVCINVNDEFRAVFMPVADRFTVLRVTDCTSSSLVLNASHSSLSL